MVSIVLGWLGKDALTRESRIMRRTAVPSATSLPDNPDDERRVRMLKYSIAMGIRMVCIILMLFVSGWWLIVCAAGAIFLPYFAVLIANQKMSPTDNDVSRPGSILPLAPEAHNHADGPRESPRFN